MRYLDKKDIKTMEDLNVLVANTLFADVDDRKYIFFISNFMKRPQDLTSFNTKILLKIYDTVYFSTNGLERIIYSQAYKNIHRRYRGN